MKRRITLYIAGQKTDLDDDALVLLNVRREDLYNPAVVLNSYSQAVTLPGTAANDIIFGHYFRADHSVAGGFNPLVRVPFSIFADTGEVLVSGYCKLLNATSQKGAHTYEVQLYGSLGEFIYGLAYDADGNKKTLASLDYLGGGDTELDFVIDKTAIAAAWARLGGDTSKPAMWDVVNFAPAYNGIPDGDFDAGKALAKPGDVGLTIPPGQQASPGGYALLELAANLDEWEARDLRSYLQRPVLSVKALLEAIAKPENNGGWTLDLSDIDTTAEWPYLRTWLTRPLLPTLGTFKQTTGDIELHWSAPATAQADLLGCSIAQAPSGTEVTIRTSFGLQVNLGSAPGRTTMFTYRNEAGGVRQSVWFLQLVGYASDDSVVAASPVTIYGPTLAFVRDLAAFAAACTFVPEVPAGQEARYVAAYGFDQGSMTGSGTAFSSRVAFTLEAAGRNMAYAKVLVKRGTILWDQFSGRVRSVQNLATLYDDPGPTATPYLEDTSELTDISVTATMQTASSLRSGSHVTKRMLLSTEGTPADYLLAICKSFGLYILADGATKTASIVRRSTLYQNEVIDLTERVDTSQPVELEPLAIESKYYEWKHADIGAAFGKEYKENTGRDYGAQRVNTGYDFDAKARNVLDGVVLKSTAAVLKFSKYLVTIDGKGTTGKSLTGKGTTIVYDTQMFPVTPGDSVDVTISGHISAATSSSQVCMRLYFVNSGGSEVLRVLDQYGTGSVNGTFTYTVPSGAAYLAAMTRQASGKDVNFAMTYPIKLPPVFRDSGNTYTLWDGDGNGQENYVPQYVGAVTPLRGLGPYDFYDKAEFREKDGKPVDGADVLLLYNGIGEALRSYPLEITDDVPGMDTLNGEPCWLFTNNTTPLQLPCFSRYDINIAGRVTLSLDFGVPSELDIPNLDYFEASTIYSQAWKRYVADRLDKDTKVLRCRVRLDGLQVGQGLLRKFYYYQGSLWALNKIENYSLTTFDTAACEFVQVRDIANYITQY